MRRQRIHESDRVEHRCPHRARDGRSRAGAVRLPGQSEVTIDFGFYGILCDRLGSPAGARSATLGRVPAGVDPEQGVQRAEAQSRRQDQHQTDQRDPVRRTVATNRSNCSRDVAIGLLE